MTTRVVSACDFGNFQQRQHSNHHSVPRKRTIRTRGSGLGGGCCPGIPVWQYSQRWQNFIWIWSNGKWQGLLRVSIESLYIHFFSHEWTLHFGSRMNLRFSPLPSQDHQPPWCPDIRIPVPQTCPVGILHVGGKVVWRFIVRRFSYFLEKPEIFPLALNGRSRLNSKYLLFNAFSFLVGNRPFRVQWTFPTQVNCRQK